MSQQPSLDDLHYGPEKVKSPATGGVLGFIAGILSALLGIGGGLFMVPATIWLLNLRPQRAVGTSLAVVLSTAAVAAWRYHLEVLDPAVDGSLDLRVALWLAVGGVFGAWWGALLANKLGARQLRRVFGVFVVATGIVMIIRNVGGDYQTAAEIQGIDSVLRMLQMIGVGVFVGVISGLLGVGGGLVYVPVLVFLLGYGQKLAQATSLMVIVPVSFSGSIIHQTRGNIIHRLAIPMAIGAAGGAFLTSRFISRISNESLGLTFGIFLIIVGFSMIIRRQAQDQQDEKQPASDPADGQAAADEEPRSRS